MAAPKDERDTPGEAPGSRRKTHWDEVFQTKDTTDASWFQAEPATSLRLVEGAGFTPHT